LAFHTESAPDSNPIEILRAFPDDLVCDGFVGRTGGVSRGPFASLNLSYWVGDDRASVDSNWERLRRKVPALKLGAVGLTNQVHGNAIHIVARKTAADRPRGDGMVTAEPGVILGIFSADCVPILMIDSKRKIAGAFHAGWRGIIADIATAGVAAMTKLGAHASDLRAALGPSIGPCCFEVDTGLADRFAAEVVGARSHTRAGKPGKAYLDLRGIVTDQLVRAGLAATVGKAENVGISASIGKVGPCTRCASDRFFSRRAASGQTTGLQMSFVGFSD
jgi:polyphenol oxidase